MFTHLSEVLNLARKWCFAQPAPAQRQRNSKLEEFFSGSGSDRAGDLVREGTQNACDAVVDDPVRIRIGFGSLDATRAVVYSAGMVEHVDELSKLRGLSGIQAIKVGQPCPYLTFEDFNTTGLTGDPLLQRRYDGDPTNAFHTFFRAEGQTDKVEDRKQGSKGVGKVAFMASSAARAVLGMTYENGKDRTIMYGTAVTQTHRFNDKDYDGDAWFGEDQLNHADPVEDKAVISDFCFDFKLTRKPGEHGFSIVVPWLITDQEDSINPDKIIDAVLRDHAWPILQCKLAVEVVAFDGTTTTIDAAHFFSVLESRSNEKLKAQVKPMAELASWALAHPPTSPNDRLGMHKDTAPSWTDPNLLPATLRDKLQASLDAGDSGSVRVPVRIKPKFDGGTDCISYIDVFLRRDTHTGTTPGPTVHFVRGGLLITGMGRRLAGLRALVVTEHTGIAGLLRDSENASHTKWNAKSIKDRYSYATGTLSFVVDAPRNLAKLLAADPAKREALWGDAISLPAGAEAFSGPAGGGSGAQKPKPRKSIGIGPIVIPPPPPKKRAYDVKVILGGFAVRPSGKPFVRLPAILELRLAYRVRGKDPIKAWEPEDFDLTKSTVFPHTLRGCKLIKREPNRLEIQIDDASFEFTLTGFHTQRELFYKPRLEQPLPTVAEDEETDAPESSGPDATLVTEAVGGAE